MLRKRSVKRSKKTPLYGLVLAGGKSTRMKKDKSLLEYHGKKQVVHCFDLLSRFCEQVFISNRKDQSRLPAHKKLPQIHDVFVDIGPLGGILSAMTYNPEVAWLVLACDLPFVNETTIQTLIKKRNASKMATAYRSAYDPHLPEPLCVIFEPNAMFQLLRFLSQGVQCPRAILLRSDTHLIAQSPGISLDNVNNPQEYRKVLSVIRRNPADK
ncbi:MAG: hypothetical protein A2705_02395 [Omnitrophica WOR_2 bacterium RIFCSPHIGHO2_01_FULL_52_10]|nr:MAG: hypothetical protein A2705_02395 [Omnitrophica WOR_2 bacterium RIFCSPHIGHO2_01_FULL_52_10]